MTDPDYLAYLKSRMGMRNPYALALEKRVRELEDKSDRLMSVLREIERIAPTGTVHSIARAAIDSERESEKASSTREDEARDVRPLVPQLSPDSNQDTERIREIARKTRSGTTIRLADVRDSDVVLDLHKDIHYLLTALADAREGVKRLVNNRHTCQYCEHPLDATKGTGIYECPRCLEYFPDTVSFNDMCKEYRAAFKILSRDAAHGNPTLPMLSMMVQKRNAELEAEVERLKKLYGVDRVSTNAKHWNGCYQEYMHHACAIEGLVRYRKALEEIIEHGKTPMFVGDSTEPYHIARKALSPDGGGE